MVENNLKDVREADLPLFVKYIIVLINIVTWKWAYYAPNTYKELKLLEMKRNGEKVPAGVDPTDAVTLKVLLTSTTPFYSLWEFFSVVAGPYLIIHFFILPLPLFFISAYFGGAPGMYTHAVKNLFLAELLTNAHAFVAIVTNHAGDDMYRFRR